MSSHVTLVVGPTLEQLVMKGKQPTVLIGCDVALENGHNWVARSEGARDTVGDPEQSAPEVYLAHLRARLIPEVEPARPMVKDDLVQNLVSAAKAYVDNADPMPPSGIDLAQALTRAIRDVEAVGS